MQQTTIAHHIHTKGMGLHSGQEVFLSLYPADINHGIVFQRTDLKDQPLIPAQADLVTDTVMSSNLVVDDAKIGTVEHLMSTLSAFGIDNLLIQVSAAEIPIMDGSAKNFVELIKKVGLTEQVTKKNFIQITKPVKVTDGDKWCELLPFKGFELNFQIDFDHPVIASTPQTASFSFDTEGFITEISNARTFGFLKDLEYLHANNLALGGNLENAIVVNDTEIMNENGLRLEDEFVRHKILDAIGDLYLIGSPLLAQYNAYKSGHALNNQLIKKVLSDKSTYKIVNFDKNEQPYNNRK